MAADKKHAYELLDRLDSRQLAAVTRLLEVMLDSLTQSILSSPLEDEQITPEMAAALDQARDSMQRGEAILHEDMLREFGLLPRR